MKGKRCAIAINTLSKSGASYALGGGGSPSIKAVKIFLHQIAYSIDKILNIRRTS
ncbi:hypothetical protein [Microcoleus sp. S13C4]|uniref:hypothetical protein n=1 Tax=Microcoleus sp. S13C4 TaxID=3055410 RepID=UPI002FCEB0C1